MYCITLRKTSDITVVLVALYPWYLVCALANHLDVYIMLENNMLRVYSKIF